MSRLLLGLPVLAALLMVSGALGEDIYSDNPWEREMAVGLAVDQEQTKASLLSGGAIGQVFTPAVTAVERVDVILKNRTDHTPGRIRLLAWAGNYADTVKQAPRWEEDADFSGPDMPVLRHYFPRVAVEPGKQYLLEVSRPSENFYAGGVQEDAYPGGFAVTDGTQRTGWDMWFRTYGPHPPAPLSLAGEGGKAGAGETPASPRPLPPLSATQPQPPRAEMPLSKEVYLKTVQTYAERSAQRWNEQGRTVGEALFYTGFLHKYAQDDRPLGQVSAWLRNGVEYMKAEGAGANPWFAGELGLGILWLRGNPQWTAQDEANARQILLTAAGRMWPGREYGAMNRSMWSAMFFRTAAELYPEEAPAAEWRAYSDKVWHQFADFYDTEEDSAHYNDVFIFFMLGYVHVTKQEAIFKEPGMVKWVARYRDVLAPNGMMVGWGDSLGIGGDWGGWAALFETAATATRDGSFKEAARRTVEGHARYILAEEPLLCVYEDMPSLVWAYIGADDAVKPAPLEGKSGLFTCAYPKLRPKNERQEGWFELEQRQTPWKLALRSSAEETAYYALLGLLPYGGHGHADAPAVLALAANGTLFLHDSTYMDRRWEDHNLLFGVRVSGGKLGTEPSETVVRTYPAGGDAGTPPGAGGAGRGAAEFADIGWQDYPGWGMGFARQVLFVKGLGWMIHDRTEAKQPGEWYLGPTWQVERLRTRGENWFDIDDPAPTSFAWPTANGTDHLLIWFAPKAGASVDYSYMPTRVRQGKPWYTSAPYCVYQEAGPLAVSEQQPAWFTSLLLPLAQDKSPVEAAQGLRVRSDSAGATVLEVRQGAVKWTLAVINDGQAHEVGPVTADARAVVVREGPGGLAIEAFGARSVKAGGKVLMEGEERKGWEVGW
jgi:hypothetical protein